MSSEVVFDQKQFRKAMDEFAKGTGLNTRDVLRDEMRLFTKAVIKMTPPDTASIGKKNIDISLGNIFGMIDDPGTLDALDTEFGSRLWPLRFDMHPAEIPVHHEKFRSRKTGKTPRLRGRSQALGGAFGKKPYVLSRDLNRYARIRKQKIGRLKGGWNRAAQVFKFKPGQWISKHGMVEGSAVDAFNPDTLAGYLEASNTVPYSTRHARIPRTAMRGRVRALQTKLSRELDRLAKAKSAR